MTNLLRATIGLALTLAPACLAATATPAPYHLVESVKLGSPDRWDYLSFDASNKRVMLAQGDRTTLLDAANGTIVGHLAPLQGAHGQVAVANGTIFADSGETGTVTIFDGKSLAPLKTVPAGQDADAVAYEPLSGTVAVMNGDPGTATLLDGSSGKRVATVPLGGSPESAAADGKGRLFINIASTGEMVRLDKGEVVARWKLADCESPHGLAVDPDSELAFVSCRNAVLLVVDGNSGAVRQMLPIGRGTDEAVFDPGSKRVFSSNGEGTVSVFQETKGKLAKLAEMPTAPGARTMTVDPASGRLYLVTAEVAGKRPGGRGGAPKFLFKPGTLKLLVFAPSPG